MGQTAPAWLEITAAAILFAGILGFVVWVVVLWVVRLRFPYSADQPLLAPRGDSLLLELFGPVRRVIREAVVPSPHQPAARRPGWRVPVGPWVPDGTAVRLPMDGTAGAGVPTARMNIGVRSNERRSRVGAFRLERFIKG
ncbi:MAG: hypothetical protein AB7O78_06125 [Thermoleophilia bacterium]